MQFGPTVHLPHSPAIMPVWPATTPRSRASISATAVSATGSALLPVVRSTRSPSGPAAPTAMLS